MSKRFTDESKIVYPYISQFYPDEIFKPIEQSIIPGIYDYYLISNHGRIFHKYLGIFLKPGISGSGYLFVCLATEFGTKICQVHRLVKLVFDPIENPENYQVNHEDGIKTNPLLSNLTWMSRSENVLHAYRTGLNHQGQDSEKTKLTNETVVKICELLESNNYTDKQIADIIGNGATSSIVESIKQRESWKPISKNYNFIQRPRKLFSDSMINNICLYFQNNSIGNLNINEYVKNALEFYGYNSNANYIDSARKIYTKKYYTNISCKYNF